MNIIPQNELAKPYLNNLSSGAKQALLGLETVWLRAYKLYYERPEKPFAWQLHYSNSNGEVIHREWA